MEVKIEGLAETIAALKNAPRNVVAQGFRRGLQAAGNVLGAEVARRTPVDRGDLLASIKVEVVLDSQFRGGITTVGFGGKEDFTAAMVEYGHHLIGHKPGEKAIGEVQPHPFVRPAAATAGGSAVDAFEREIKEVLQEYET